MPIGEEVSMSTQKLPPGTSLNTLLPQRAQRLRACLAGARFTALVAALGTASVPASGCGARAANIPGSRIPDTSINRAIIERLNAYRQAIERKDAAALLLMASKSYWEDSGTPSGSDDYGYDGLRNVLTQRLQKANDVRYTMRYITIRRSCPGDTADLAPGCRAQVEVLIDASYTVADARGGERRPDMRDQNELVLEWSGSDWLFLSGM